MTSPAGEPPLKGASVVLNRGEDKGGLRKALMFLTERSEGPSMCLKETVAETNPLQTPV